MVKRWPRVNRFVTKDSPAKMTLITVVTTKEKIIFLTKFFTSRSFRENTGYPWIQWVLKSNWEKIKLEVVKSEEMLVILWKFAYGQKVSFQEKKMAKAQLLEIIRMIPALAIFLLPGGLILLPILARALPWELLPTSFRQKHPSITFTRPDGKENPENPDPLLNLSESENKPK